MHVPRLKLRLAIRQPGKKLRLKMKLLTRRKKPLLRRNKRLKRPEPNLNACSKKPLRLMRLVDWQQNMRPPRPRLSWKMMNVMLPRHVAELRPRRLLLEPKMRLLLRSKPPLKPLQPCRRPSLNAKRNLPSKPNARELRTKRPWPNKRQSVLPVKNNAKMRLSNLV